MPNQARPGPAVNRTFRTRRRVAPSAPLPSRPPASPPPAGPVPVSRTPEPKVVVRRVTAGRVTSSPAPERPGCRPGLGGPRTSRPDGAARRISAGAARSGLVRRHRSRTARPRRRSSGSRPARPRCCTTHRIRRTSAEPGLTCGSAVPRTPSGLASWPGTAETTDPTGAAQARRPKPPPFPPCWPSHPPVLATSPAVLAPFPPVLALSPACLGVLTTRQRPESWAVVFWAGTVVRLCGPRFRPNMLETTGGTEQSRGQER